MHIAFSKTVLTAKVRMRESVKKGRRKKFILDGCGGWSIKGKVY